MVLTFLFKISIGDSFSDVLIKIKFKYSIGVFHFMKFACIELLKIRYLARHWSYGDVFRLVIFIYH